MQLQGKKLMCIPTCILHFNLTNKKPLTLINESIGHFFIGNIGKRKKVAKSVN